MPPKKVKIKRGTVTKREMIGMGWTTPERKLKDNAPVEAVKGVGHKKAKKFRKKGVKTVGKYWEFQVTQQLVKK